MNIVSKNEFAFIAAELIGLLNRSHLKISIPMMPYFELKYCLADLKTEKLLKIVGGFCNIWASGFIL